MILIPHIIVGATIGSKLHSIWLIAILSLLSHYILDKIPHWDYTSGGVKNFLATNQFKYLAVFILKVFIDFFIGFIIIIIMILNRTLPSDSLKYIFVGFLFAIMPDITLGASFLFKNSTFSQKYFAFHKKYLHFKHENEKEGKITFLGLFSQIVIIAISLLLFFS